MPTKKSTKKSTKKATPRKTSASKKATPKKKVAKKAAPKKRSTSQATTSKKKRASTRKPILVCADGADCFWVKDGPILKDLTELGDALQAMTDEVFAHHVDSNRNDFADWVEFVLGDTSCADSLRKSTKAHTAQTVVVKRLRYYSG